MNASFHVIPAAAPARAQLDDRPAERGPGEGGGSGMVAGNAGFHTRGWVVVAMTWRTPLRSTSIASEMRAPTTVGWTLRIGGLSEDGDGWQFPLRIRAALASRPMQLLEVLHSRALKRPLRGLFQHPARPVEEGHGDTLGPEYVVDALLGALYPERAIRVVNMVVSGDTARELRSRCHRRA